MLTKTQVYEFIDKVERKALETVRSNYKTELDKAIKSALNEPQNRALLDAIESMEKHIAEGVKAQRVIKRNVPYWYAFLNESDIRQELFGSNRWNYPDGFDGVKSVHVEFEEKIRRTREEYAKIKRIVKNKKTGDQGKTALISLGFDVAYLDKLSTLPVVINETEFKADKSLLFPCGEYGVSQ